MNSLDIKLPYRYVMSHAVLNGKALKFAIDHGDMAKTSAREHAEYVIVTEDSPSRLVMDRMWQY